jgi:hypothetical protein
MTNDRLETYLRERHEALRTLDMAWARRQAKAMGARNINDDELLAGMHKARYEVVDMPRELRHESAAWLRERGLGAMGGRPLLPEGKLP